MARSFSIRRQLALHALLTGIVMLCLALAFAWSQHETDRAIQRIVSQELRPAAALRRMESRLQAVHGRMQSVLLSQASPLGALELLARERRVIDDSWRSFRREHRNWLDDPDEDALIADIERALPRLGEFFDLVDAAYRIYDPVQLTMLVDGGWYQVEESLVYNLRSLAELQELHVVAATRELDASIRQTRLWVGGLLAGGLLILAVFSVRLGRHIMRRIVEIEVMLEAVAEGEPADLPVRPGETEMERITTAIARTLARLAEDRSAITGLMHQQQTILESAAEGIYGTDRDGRIMFINAAALAMLGYRETEVIGCVSHELLHHHYPDGRPYPLADCPIAAARCGGHSMRRDDEVFFRKDGSAFAIEYTCAPLLDLNQQMGGVVVFHDITDRRAQERLLQQTVEQLRDTNERLAQTQMQLIQAEKLAGLGQLAAGVAHEINNPIGFVRSNLTTLEAYVGDLFKAVDGYERLLRQGTDAAARSAADRLRETTDLEFLRGDMQALLDETRDGLQRVIRIVADLRDFSRIDAPASYGDIDLAHALDSTVNMVLPTVQGRIEIVRDYAAIPAVRGDAAQLNQVFLNLLLNATQAIDGQGSITLRTRAAADGVCVEVADTGCGMSDEVRARMFDPFYTTRPVGQGTGLGLSIAYSAIQNHGGRFEVDSAPGRGTSIRLWLPVSTGAPAVASTAAAGV